MPKAPAVPPNKVYEALKELYFLDGNGQLLPWGDDVWEQAFEALDHKMSKAYIYLYLSTNRNDVFRRIHGAEALDTSEAPSVLTNDRTVDDSRGDLNWSMGESNCMLPPLRKAIEIPRSEWDGIKSHIAAYKDREYEVLVIGWTDKVYDALWDYMRLPCPFAFKNAKMSRIPGEIFLTIKGHCSECNSNIHIYCIEEPTGDGPVTLRVSTFDSTGVAHDRKRQVRGEKRVRIGKQLTGKSVYAWRREEANRLMKFGDVEPASLPSEEVARKLKQEARDKDLGLYKVQQALASVWEMKYSPEFSGSIHEIGLDKFHLLYWTPTQLFMYRKFRAEKTVCSMSIDATGSLVKQIVNPAGEKRVVYLYQVVCSYRGKILPLFQWISEKHDANLACYCIREWLRSGGSCPDEFVTDYSLALLNAMSLACNNCDLKTYIDTCLVFDGRDLSSVRIRRPRTVLRVDIAHLIKLVTRWECFKHESAHKKDFYLRCVGLLTMCTEIPDFITLCTDVATIAFSSHEDIDDPDSHCFAAQNRVMQRLKSFDLPIDAPETEGNSDPICPELIDDFDEQELGESRGAIDAILKQIKADSANQLSQGRLNPYYCADFGSRLLRLSKQFVLWTAVMADDSGSLVATSARSEEYFRELKHLILKNGKPIRLDKFLVIHLRSLEGTNKLLNAPQKESKKGEPRISRAMSDKPKSVTGSAVQAEIAHTMPTVLDLTATESRKCGDTSFDSRVDSEVFPIFESENSAYECPLNRSPVESTEEVATGETIESDNPIGNSMQPVNDDTHDQSEIHCSEDLLSGVGEASAQCRRTAVDSAASEMAYLNEIEAWKLGRVINPPEPKVPLKGKKRGKFLTPCPDIEIIHKRRKFTPKLPLLVNASALEPVKIGKQTVRVRNTCAFDTSIQSILAGCHDFEPYAEYLGNFGIKIFDFVQKLSTTGTSAALYAERGSILSATKPIIDGILDCEICISYLQEKYILQDMPSLAKTVNCGDCLFEVVKTLPVLHVDPFPLHQRGMKGLQEAVDKTFSSRSTSTCFRCKSTNITKSLSGGNHLMINIEDVGNDILADRNGFPNCRKTFTLEEIPDKLTYDGHTYKLVSVIVYTTAHYFAFIKRVTGKWEEHNDLLKTVRSVTARTLLLQHRVVEVFYIRVQQPVS